MFVCTFHSSRAGEDQPTCCWPFQCSAFFGPCPSPTLNSKQQHSTVVHHNKPHSKFYPLKAAHPPLFSTSFTTLTSIAQPADKQNLHLQTAARCSHSVPGATCCRHLHCFQLLVLLLLCSQQTGPCKASHIGCHAAHACHTVVVAQQGVRHVACVASSCILSDESNTMCR